ncbi:hypothetical protein B0T25DRAFT_548391 [Lasiosphaeria hispida]|uniref:Kelch repeat protein n=1 Tax=Lasiosphaeria hispida TaxID=260671 RepID=A0AAJ0HEW6_9PEZI|nr:hypothetical protein B0T25DRAFT_548391 [Lasiosphaeria hispida]
MATFSTGWNNSGISAALDPSGSYQHCNFQYPSVGILNNRLYLDGGETRMMVGDNPNESFYETNPRLLWVDLSVPFGYSNYTVTSRSKPDTVPSLSLGAGFASTRKFFRFGGYYPMNNVSARHLETSPGHTDEVGLTWSYDALSEVWAREPNAGILTGLAAGASATNPFTNEAYFLGGGQDSWVLQGSPDFYVDGMVSLNMTDASWRNDTVPGPAISGGFLEYLPIGEKGALVSFGGMGFPEGVAGASSSKPYPMEVIRIYDILSRTWLSQNATVTASNGPSSLTPDTRILGCTAWAAAPDNSSHNIYLFGGQRELHGPLTKDLWILSLPSFTWIKAGDDAFGAIGHSCRRAGVGGRHMIVVGAGERSAATCQPFFRILDMSTLEWTNRFDPSAPLYTVPPAIYAAVGGDGNGRAKTIAPAHKGGDWPALKALFRKTPWGPNAYLNFTGDENGSTTANPGVPIPTATGGGQSRGPNDTPTSGSSLSKGAVAGIVVGSAVGMLILVLVVFWVLMRARKAGGGADGRNGAGKMLGREYPGELHGQGITAGTPIFTDGATRAEMEGERNALVVPGLFEANTATSRG